ncbi:MAG: hypothetical protein AB7E48_07120 [Deferribacterales bacterium]
MGEKDIPEEYKQRRIENFWVLLANSNIDLIHLPSRVERGDIPKFTEKELELHFQTLYEVITEAYPLRSLEENSDLYLRKLEIYSGKHNAGFRRTGYNNEILQMIKLAETNSLALEIIKLSLAKFIRKKGGDITKLLPSLPEPLITLVFESFSGIMQEPEKIRKNHKNLIGNGYVGYARGLMVWALKVLFGIPPYHSEKSPHKKTNANVRSGCQIAEYIFRKNGQIATPNTFRTAYGKFKDIYVIPEGLRAKD